MSIKENIVTLIDGGEQRRFRVRQFSASQGERVRLKMMFLLGANADVDKLMSLKNEEPISFIGYLINAAASQPYEKVQELLDEMLSCVSRIQDGGIESQLTPVNVDGFISDTNTLMALRGEVIKINDFFPQSGQNDLPKSPAPDVVIKRKN